MSAWAVMASIGLFQIDGGCRVTPEYEIASPSFEKIVIDFGGKVWKRKEFYNQGEKCIKEEYICDAGIFKRKKTGKF